MLRVCALGLLLCLGSDPVYAKKILGVDLQKSQVFWVGKKFLGGQHKGQVRLKKAQLELVAGDIVGGEFVVDMNSISCDDLKDKKENADLVNHLKGEDFFQVQKYPEAILKIKNAYLGKGGHFEAMVDMTIKGVTKRNMPLKIVRKKNAGKIAYESSFIFDRTLFGVTYKSKKFFDLIKERAIRDDVELRVHLELKD